VRKRLAGSQKKRKTQGGEGVMASVGATVIKTGKEQKHYTVLTRIGGA